MAAVAKVTVAMQKQILELHAQGLTARKIAKILKVSRNTIRTIINRNTIIDPGTLLPAWAKPIDWAQVRLDVARGVPMNILAREHAGDVISYVQFWRQFYKKYPSVPQVTMRLDHKPGEKCFFDYADGIDIVDKSSGEVQKTSLCCGVMAMSSYTFGEFTLTERRQDLICAMENAFRYFGGVTPYVTVVQKQFFQKVRNQTFYSLGELNKAFRSYLERLNTSVMKDWGVSRKERFTGEQEHLKPCPLNNWEVAEWRSAKVHADCHVQVLKKFYSVPFKHVGREVRVKATAKLISIFDQDLNPLSTHVRLLGRETHSTDTRHYPEEKLALTQFSVQLALKNAGGVGPETQKLAQELLGGSYPLKYLRRVQGILRFYQSQRVTREGLEHAAKLAMTFGKLQITYVQSAAEYFDKNGNRPSAVRAAPVRDAASIYLHNPTPKEET